MSKPTDVKFSMWEDVDGEKSEQLKQALIDEKKKVFVERELHPIGALSKCNVVRTVKEFRMRLTENYTWEKVEHGTSREYVVDHNGEHISYEYTYVDGKRNGPYNNYYIAGKDHISHIFSRGEYLNDKLHGTEYLYSPNGAFLRVITWNNGCELRKTDTLK